MILNKASARNMTLPRIVFFTIPWQIGGVPAWVGFEFMAQSFSVLSGLRCREKGEKPRNGFILSVPFLRMEIPFFKNNSSVEIRVRETDCTDMIYSFEGEAFAEGVKAVEGKLMVSELSDERFKELASGACVK